MSEVVRIAGAGLAGCEAAWRLANEGFRVLLYEMKPQRFSPAHSSPKLAELVCSNSLKAKRVESAAGLLKEEMRRLGSLTVPCAEQTAVGAGGALAVDRSLFSELITRKITERPEITLIREEITDFDVDTPWIIATGPLTSDSLAAKIETLAGGALSFYDAAAPIVTAGSIDMEKVFFAARYGRGDDDYINCPMDKTQYDEFYGALVGAEQTPLHEFERNLRVYEGCMPVEVMARRGPDTLRFGPMKPKGLTDPRTGARPWAVVQLRAENAAGSMYNLVGFQTNLKFGEQKRVFSLIPGLENAEFARYGVMHRNTFLDSPRVLAEDGSLLSCPNLFFAGQITGVEGYMESAMSGIVAGIQVARQLRGKSPVKLPTETMSGALMNHITDRSQRDFQPMGSAMGLLPELTERVRGKQERYRAYADRALNVLDRWLVETEER